MRKQMVVVFVLFILPTFAFAQAQPEHASKPADVNCAFTFSSGIEHGVTQYCVTANGNIAQFSVGTASGIPTEMFSGVAPASEGYGICDILTLKNYYDYARNDSGNWNPATVVAGTNSVTITRTTTDGIWKLVQTIIQRKGSKSAYGAAEIKMALTNTSTFERLAIIYRHVNVDAQESTFNDFDTSENTAFALVPGQTGFASVASFVTTKFDFHFSIVKTSPDGPTPCIPIGDQGGQQSFFQGDGSLDQFFNLDILPGRTKTITVTYKPI